MYINFASSYLRSLLLTSIVAFLVPVLAVGSAIVGALLVGLLPGLDSISHTFTRMVVLFLEVFGNGNAWEGLLVIGCACGLVGALFDTYNFYFYQNMRDD